MEQMVTNNCQLFVPIELKRVKGYAFVDTGAAFCVIGAKAPTTSKIATQLSPKG